MIKLKGLFSTSLGGFLCIRGYAKLGDLAKVSKTEPSYQRDLLSGHKVEITQFLSDRTNLFFPEVILSCKLRYDFSKKNAVSGLNPIADIQNKKGFKSNVDKTTIKFQKSNDLATIAIYEDTKEALLSRVDGNHRLSAASLKEEFKEYITPFCIIILSDDRDDNRKDKIIFHNINFKAIPLDEEHSLKIILEDKDLFPDDSLKSQNFGWEYFFTRKIIEHVFELRNISVIQSDKKYRTLIKNIAKILLDKKIIERNDKSIEKICESLKEIDLRCKSKPYLGENIGVFSVLVIIQIDKPKLVDSFIKWVEDSQMYSIKEISSTTLLDIFNKRMEVKCRDVFISLNTKHKESLRNCSLIESVIQDINKQYFEHKKELKLIPIRIDKSDTPCTFQITDKIIQKIEDCGLFIADLTGMNPNVYQESGYAMGYIKGKDLDNKIIFILYYKKGARNVDKQVAFNFRNSSQIRFYDRKKLKREISQKIKQNYGL
ncbi:hypothetical protein KKC91_02990 [bacterium]|nr:hypothetical protein [bacterium]